MAFKVLIVDDSDLVCASLGKLLKGIPAIEQIYSTDSMTGALVSMKRHAPNFVVLDLHLRDGIALQRVEAFRRLTRRADVAVLTNHTSEYNRKASLAAGAGAFFDKSTEFELLLDLLRHRAALH